MFTKPRVFKAQREVSVSKAGSGNARVFFTDPGADRIQQKFPALTHSNVTSQGNIAAASLLIAPLVPRDADRAFTVENAGQVSKLRFAEHETFEMVCSHAKYTISQLEGIAA